MTTIKKIDLTSDYFKTDNFGTSKEYKLLLIDSIISRLSGDKNFNDIEEIVFNCSSIASDYINLLRFNNSFTNIPTALKKITFNNSLTVELFDLTKKYDDNDNQELKVYFNCINNNTKIHSLMKLVNIDVEIKEINNSNTKKPNDIGFPYIENVNFKYDNKNKKADFFIFISKELYNHYVETSKLYFNCPYSSLYYDYYREYEYDFIKSTCDGDGKENVELVNIKNPHILNNMNKLYLFGEVENFYFSFYLKNYKLDKETIEKIKKYEKIDMFFVLFLYYEEDGTVDFLKFNNKLILELEPNLLINKTIYLCHRNIYKYTVEILTNQTTESEINNSLTFEKYEKTYEDWNANKSKISLDLNKFSYDNILLEDKDTGEVTKITISPVTDDENGTHNQSVESINDEINYKYTNQTITTFNEEQTVTYIAKFYDEESKTFVRDTNEFKRNLKYRVYSQPFVAKYENITYDDFQNITILEDYKYVSLSSIVQTDIPENETIIKDDKLITRVYDSLYDHIDNLKRDILSNLFNDDKTMKSKFIWKNTNKGKIRDKIQSLLKDCGCKYSNSKSGKGKNNSNVKNWNYNREYNAIKKFYIQNGLCNNYDIYVAFYNALITAANEYQTLIRWSKNENVYGL